MANRLDPAAAAHYHLLLVDARVRAADVEGLARSRFPYAGRLDLHTIAFGPQVQLTGPWDIPPGHVDALHAPSWVTQAYAAQVPQVRAGALPTALSGLDPIQDAYAQAVPAGLELDVLSALRAMARRLGGALHLAASAVTIVPDPEEAVDLTVFAPRSLTPSQVGALLPDFQLRHRSRSSWEGVLPTTSGELSLAATRHPMPPLALAAYEWAGLSPRAYEVRWHADEQVADFRAVRRTVIEHVEWVAARLAGQIDGVVLDDDGFLVEL